MKEHNAGISRNLNTVLLGALLVIGATIAVLLMLVLQQRGSSSLPVLRYEEATLPVQDTAAISNISEVEVVDVTGSKEAPKKQKNLYPGKEGSEVVLPHMLELTRGEDIRINWHVGAIPLSVAEQDALLVSLAKKERSGYVDAYCNEGPNSDVFLFEAGAVDAPALLRGEKVYHLFYPIYGMDVVMNFNHLLVYFDKDRGGIVAILDQNNKTDFVVRDSVLADELCLNKSLFVGTFFTNLDSIQKTRMTISLTEGERLVFKGGHQESEHLALPFSPATMNNIGGVYDVKNSKVVKKAGDQVVGTDPHVGTIYKDDIGFYIIKADGAVHYYDLLPEFLLYPEEGEEKKMYARSYEAQVTFHDAPEVAAEQKYRLGGDIKQGCSSGINRLSGVVNNKPWFDEDLLEEVGKTSTEDGIFTLSNKETNAYYKEVFSWGFGGALYRYKQDDIFSEKELLAMTEEDKYALFLSEHPIIFWQDRWGDWRVYINADLQSLAECGKPVIYLYPEKTQEVNVQVAPNEGFTVTDPEYPAGGWNVVAQPNGQLYYPKNKTVYPYLFWEGHASGFGFPQEGFVFAKDEVEVEMHKVLTALGLNDIEISDFLEFWLPKMTTNSYVYVTFASQADFERAAPLRVTPQPDTTIRVFMNFKTLNQPISVNPLHITTPKRDGFTVVEWGGMLYK